MKVTQIRGAQPFWAEGRSCITFSDSTAGDKILI